ncbi:MAG: ABC transporter ATP-binding protein [Bacteroidota bacterium]
MDGFGLAMFLPLLKLVDGSNTNGEEGLGNLNFLVKGMSAIGLTLTLGNVLMILCLFFVFKGLALYVSSLYEVVVRQYFVKKIRRKLTVLMGQLSYKSFVLSDVGTIQNALSGEVARISTAYLQYFATVQQLVMVIVYMLFAFFVDAKFALLICLGGGLSSVIYRKVYALTKDASRKLTFGTNYYQGLIIQYVNSFKYLKATGLLNVYNKKLIGTIEHIEETNRKIGKLGALVSATREPILILVVSGVILMQINFLGGALSTILISLLFFYRALSSMMLMQSSYNAFLGVAGSMENMVEFERELVDNQEKDGKYKLEKFNHEIKLEHASFGYLDSLILKDLSLTVQRNQTIAFVGESGSGKSTLVNILAGLIPLSGGTLTIDGHDRNSLNIATFQKRIGYITQDPVVFNDTIFNNVTFWDKPSPESYARFEKAIKQASIKDFIDTLPAKEKTELGNNGINLSGGQKQRISIARELYKDIDILILDEATSALDSETERTIQSNIEALHGKYTVLIVAHRLSTIKNADIIVVMNQGRIIDKGNFNQLVTSSSKFKKMTELQEL